MRTLSAPQLDEVAEEGYLVVEGVLAPAWGIRPLLDGHEGVLEGIAVPSTREWMNVLFACE